MVTAQQGPRLGKGLVPGSTTSAEAASTTASARAMAASTVAFMRASLYLRMRCRTP